MPIGQTGSKASSPAAAADADKGGSGLAITGLTRAGSLQRPIAAQLPEGA